MRDNVIDTEAAKVVQKGVMAVASDDWSQEQQKALERGLIAFPASAGLSPTDRWTKIAGMVDGKDPKECVAHYKQICAEVKAKATKK